MAVTSDVALPGPDTDASAASNSARVAEACAETEASKDDAAAEAEEAAAETEARADEAAEASADGGEPEKAPVFGEKLDPVADGAVLDVELEQAPAPAIR